MNNNKPITSEGPSLTTLRKFFSTTPDSDEVDVETIFEIYKRTNKSEATNRAWLSNKLVGLRKNGLIIPIYSFEPYRVLRKIKLTNRGRSYLGRISESTTTTTVPPTGPTGPTGPWGSINQGRVTGVRTAMNTEVPYGYPSNYLGYGYGLNQYTNDVYLNDILSSIENYNRMFSNSDFKLVLSFTSKNTPDIS